MRALSFFRSFLSVSLSVAVLALPGCSTVSEPAGNTDSLQNLQNLSAPPPSVKPSAGLSEMRTETLKEIAMTVGAQSGLHWRAEQINALLQSKSKTLDRAYDFNKVLLPHNVLPPVLTTAKQTLNLDSPDTIRLADQTYEIVSQAKFVTTAPTWRDYLWMNYPQPPVPDQGVLPHNSDEKAKWKRFAFEGWQKGVDQANEIYQENLARLNRDYKGVLLYSNLRAQNIVSAPFVSTTELGVTGGGSNLNVNDQILRITALPALQSNSQRWHAAVITPPDQP